MLQACENLPFVAEPADDRLGVHAAAQDLHRDALLILVVAAHRQVDRAHAAAAELAHQAIRADTHAFDGVRADGFWIGGSCEVFAGRHC